MNLWPVVLVAVLGGGLFLLEQGGGAAPVATPTRTPSLAPTPTQAPLAGTGELTFIDTSSGRPVVVGSFKTTAKLAWSVSLSEPAGATTLTFILASRNSSGVEKIIVKRDVEVSDPTTINFGNSPDLAALVPQQVGTYVMRYLRGAIVLAEGTFTLEK